MALAMALSLLPFYTLIFLSPAGLPLKPVLSLHRRGPVRPASFYHERVSTQGGLAGALNELNPEGGT